MGRGARGRVKARDKRPAGLKPVERVEVSGKNMTRRVVAFIVVLAIAMGALTYGVYSWLSGEPGWMEVQVSSGDIHCGESFTFNYLFEDGGSLSAERHKVTSLYTEAAVNGYRQFSAVDEMQADGQDVHNLCYINAHPNEDIVVDPVLYNAFEQAAELQDRTVYLGPVYSVYENMFFCDEDFQAVQFDPYSDDEAADLVSTLSAFASDPSHVSLELLEENTIRLNVSPEYQAYARDVERECYLDFGWQRNAYIIDYMADTLLAQGCVDGVITSVDGYTRSLGGQVGRQVYSACDWTGEGAIVAGEANFPDQVNLVSLCSFPVVAMDMERFYMFEDGQIRNPYIDMADGLCKASVSSLAVYSRELTCVQMAHLASAAFINDDFDSGTLSSIQQAGGDLVIVDGDKIVYTQEGLVLDNIYQQNGRSYQVEKIN